MSWWMWAIVCWVIACAVILLFNWAAHKDNADDDSQ